MIHEFRELIPVRTPLGPALALLIECNNHDNWWTVILVDTGGVVTYPQQSVMIDHNYSLGVTPPADKELHDAIARQYARLFRRTDGRGPATTGQAPVVHGSPSQGAVDEGAYEGSGNGTGQG